MLMAANVRGMTRCDESIGVAVSVGIDGSYPYCVRSINWACVVLGSYIEVDGSEVQKYQDMWRDLKLNKNLAVTPSTPRSTSSNPPSTLYKPKYLVPFPSRECVVCLGDGMAHCTCHALRKLTSFRVITSKHAVT
jgi:hypothetical protein